MTVLHKEKRVRDEEAAKKLAERRRQEELERHQKIAENIRKAEEAEKKKQAELREQEHHQMLAFISIAQHWKKHWIRQKNFSHTLPAASGILGMVRKKTHYWQ